MLKFMLTLMLALACTNSFAHKAKDGAAGLITGKCYPSYPSEYTVTTKIDEGVYFMVGNWMSPSATLKTKIDSHKMNIIRKMGPLNMNLKFMGTKEVSMQNGFTETVDFWEDCDPFQKPKGKPADCQNICFKREEKKLFKKGETLESCLQAACK